MARSFKPFRVVQQPSSLITTEYTVHMQAMYVYNLSGEVTQPACLSLLQLYIIYRRRFK